MYILLQPIITEKSMIQANAGWYTFKVSKLSSKPAIALAVSNQFNVSVTRVRTVTMPGKTQKTGKKRIETTGISWKKALVQLKKDQKIELFDFTQNINKK